MIVRVTVYGSVVLESGGRLDPIGVAAPFQDAREIKPSPDGSLYLMGSKGVLARLPLEAAMSLIETMLDSHEAARFRFDQALTMAYGQSNGSGSGFGEGIDL